MTDNPIIRECSVYGLYSSIDSEIRYVGQTILSVEARARQHIALALTKKKHTHRDCWIRKTIKSGADVRWVVLQSNAEWNKDEIAWIEKLTKSGSLLVNATMGGEGMANAPKELRERISIKVKELWKDPEYRSKTIAAQTGNKWSEKRRATNDGTDPKIRSQRASNGRKKVAKDTISAIAKKAANAHWAAKRANGTDRGIHCNGAKLNDCKVIEIRRMHENGDTIKSISIAFGVSTTCIGKIVHRKTWSHI